MPLLPCCGRRAARSVQLVDEQDGAGTKRRLSGNTKSLLVMFFLFTTITAAQWVAGLMAHSLSLQADCASMAVDALSYLGNMVAECRTDQRSRARLELGMSAFSLLLLAWFTLLFMAKAVNSVAIAESAEHQVEVYFEPRWRFKIYTPAWRFAVIAAILVEANDSYASEIASLLAALVSGYGGLFLS